MTLTGIVLYVVLFAMVAWRFLAFAVLGAHGMQHVLARTLVHFYTPFG